MTLAEVVQKACRYAAPGSALVAVPLRPEPEARPNECFTNCQAKVEVSGGSVQHGWSFSANTELLAVVHHAVWQSPEGLLLDLTPFPTVIPLGAALPLGLADGNLLFLPDDSATPLQYGLPRPVKFFPLTNNPKVKKLVRDRNRKEWLYWEAARRGDLKAAVKYKPKIARSFAP